MVFSFSVRSRMFHAHSGRGGDHRQFLTSFGTLPFLGSATPNEVYRDKAVPFVPKDAKAAPEHIEVKHFAETKITGYRLKQAA